MIPEVVRSVRREPLILVVYLRGKGTQEDRYREVTAVFTDDGTCIAEHDPCYPTPWYASESACREARA